MATSGTLKMIQDHQNKMDEILATADQEMNLGKQELENIDSFEKTLAAAREENESKIRQTRAKLAEIEDHRPSANLEHRPKRKTKKIRNEEEELFDDDDSKAEEDEGEDMAEQQEEEIKPVKAIK